MKITKDYLKKIIKEEVEQMAEAEKLTPLQQAVIALERQFGAGSVSIGNKPAREVAGLKPAPVTKPVEKPAAKAAPAPKSKPQQYIKSKDFGQIPVGAIDTSREGT